MRSQQPDTKSGEKTACETINIKGGTIWLCVLFQTPIKCFIVIFMEIETFEGNGGNTVKP